MTPTIRIWLRQRRWLSVALLVAAPGLPSSGSDAAEAVDFNRDIRPLLVAISGYAVLVLVSTIGFPAVAAAVSWIDDITDAR